MEIDIYNREWFNYDPMPEVRSFAIVNQPSEKVNLDRTSDSSPFQEYVCSPADDVPVSNCNSIYYIDNTNLGELGTLFDDPYFRAIDDLQLDCILILNDGNYQEVTFVTNSEEPVYNPDSGLLEYVEITKKYYQINGDQILNNMIYQFISEVFFKRYDGIGSYDLFGYLNTEDYSGETDPQHLLKQWMVTYSAFDGVDQDCTFRYIKRTVHTYINIIETLIYQ